MTNRKDIDPRRERKWRASPLLLFMSSLLGCSSDESYFSALPHFEVPPELAECAATVDAYIARGKGWHGSDYRIVFERFDSELAQFRVSHIDDYKQSARRGAGMSIFVQIDCRSSVVIRELGML